MMTSSSACTTQVKRGTMPTLGNNNIRGNNNKEHVKHIVFSDRGSSSKLASATNTIKTNHVAIKPFVPTAKLTLDGKVVDIDVLTKLQQQNGGNIVSFTASKEFLSNLASAKINPSKIITGTPKSRVNKQDVSVFKSLTGKKSQQEKVLLPKNQLNGFVPQKSRIEVKKFAPEIKGLLSGLSTALKTSSAVCVNTSNNSREVHSSPQVSNGVSCNGITEQTKRNLLLAVKTTEHITPYNTSYSTLNNLNTNITTSVGARPTCVSQLTNNRQAQTSNLRKTSWNSCIPPQTSSVIVQNSARVARTQSVITSIGSSKGLPFNKPSYNPFELTQKLKQTNQIAEEEKIKRSPTCNKKVPTCGKKDNYAYSADLLSKTYESQFHPVINTKEVAAKASHTFGNGSNDVKGEPRQLAIKQETKTSIFDSISNPQKSKSSIANFTELYENAVRNVLNIKAFSDSSANVTNTTSYSKQIEKAFETYLKRPVEFDIKLDRFQYSRSSRLQDSPNNNQLDVEPFVKRARSEDIFLNTDETHSNGRQPSPDDISNTLGDKAMEYFKLFDFKRRQHEEKKAKLYESQNKLGEIDNRSFFAQFLSDQAFFTQNQPHSYYSPADFPWLYPSYMYEKYYQTQFPYYYYGDYHNENLNDTTVTSQGSTNNHDDDSNNTQTLSLPKIEQEEEPSEITSIATAITTTTTPLPPPPPPPPPPSPPHTETVETPQTINEQNPFRMKLNAVLNEQCPIIKEEIKEEEEEEEEEEEPGSSPSTQCLRKKCRSKKEPEKITKESPVQPRKMKTKESLKYRPYSLRQRVKALKKAKKRANLNIKETKYILKDMNAKNLTKKEIFLGYLGLRRILKRNDKKGNDVK